MQEHKDRAERLLKKVMQLSMLPLEEAMAFVNVPVYGLTQEVCGLHHSQHVYNSENAMRLGYYSPRYKQHEKVKGRQTFVVDSRLYEENVIPEKMLGLPETLVLGSWIWDDIQDRRHVFIAKGAVFTIDGKCFKGIVNYHPVPLCYASFSLCSGHIKLSGEALGPSIDEMIQILESLRVLNGKEVESSR